VSHGWNRKDIPAPGHCTVPSACSQEQQIHWLFSIPLSPLEIFCLCGTGFSYAVGQTAEVNSVCNTRLRLQLCPGQRTRHSQTDVLTFLHSAYSVSVLHNTNLERTTGKEVMESSCLKEQRARVTNTRGKTRTQAMDN